MVALGGDVPQRAVDVNGGAFGDVAARRSQNRVGGLAFGHRLHARTPDKGVLGLDIPIRRAADAGLHVGAGGLKGLLTGQIADGLAANLDPKHKRLCQCGAHVENQRRPRRQRQQQADKAVRVDERCTEICRRPHRGPQHHGGQPHQRPGQLPQPKCRSAPDPHGGVFDMEADKI